MRRTLFALFALFTLLVVTAPAARAADTSILDPSRLSVGARIYRTFDQTDVSERFTSEWRVGLPLAWQLTSSDDPSVKFPISLVGAFEYGIPSKGVRLSIGAVVLLKRAGR